MTKKLLLIGCVAMLSAGLSAVSYAQQVTVTASTTVSNVPKEFSQKAFALLRPWERDQIPSFIISAIAKTEKLSVNPLNTAPALDITDSTQSLSWFYYCDGLKFHYKAGSEAFATVVFTGKINATRPGSGVQCTCSGPACSTTHTVPATLMIG